MAIKAVHPNNAIQRLTYLVMTFSIRPTKRPVAASPRDPVPPECHFPTRPETGPQPLRTSVLTSATTALIGTFTASSIGSLKGTSIRSNPFT